MYRWNDISTICLQNPWQVGVGACGQMVVGCMCLLKLAHEDSLQYTVHVDLFEIFYKK